MEMTSARWEATSDYLQNVFGRPDDQLATLMERAVAAGIPDIAVSADVGRLLTILTQLAAPGGARLAIEVGTLAGYSGIWIARGLSAGGKLFTVELEGRHADFARREFDQAGVGERVHIRRGAALDVLPQLARELGPASVDLVFLDAIKTDYPDYARILKPALSPGGLLLADNALGSGSWWIDQPRGENPERDAVDDFNRMIAGDPDFQAAAIPIRQGLLIARKMQ
jgi:predicted O-methyltransferase YrrM